MRLHILSDLHIEFGDFDPPATDADVVVLAGDIHLGTQGVTWVLKHFRDVPVIYVAGNHEHYRQNLQRNLRNIHKKAAFTNVHFLENDAVVINGVTFLGCTLWTDFALLGDSIEARRLSTEVMADYRVIRTNPGNRVLETFDTSIMHDRSVAWLTGEFDRRRGQRIVVVTHHSPSGRSVPERFSKDPVSASFSSNLDRLVKVSGAVMWIHGHTHDSFGYSIGKTPIIANPRGYVGVEPNPRFQPDLVIDIRP